jgi:hypothetical protein
LPPKLLSLFPAAHSSGCPHPCALV